ncbi:MAG: hypothetical protein ABIP35_02075 [Ginsengibacter sp.]
MNSEGHFSNTFLSNFLDEKSVLEKNVEDYPASALARVLLWNHYKKTNDAALEKFSKQSALFFNNPAWMQFQFFYQGVPAKKEDLPATTSTEHFAVTIPVATATEELQQDDSYVTNEVDTITFEPEEITQEKVKISDDVVEENLIPVETENFISKEEDLHDGFEENEKDEDSFSTTDEENKIENTSVSEHTGNDALIEVQDPSTQDVDIDQIKDEKDEVSETPEKDQSPVVGAVIDEAEEKSTDEIAFEPLHTVDYFASQGIKIKEELLANDKLGKQMKSFTDWLKSMKKLHPGKLPEQNEVIERIIQTSAEESNADAEVLTEAMAEVLVKQDKKQKAIEMYEKLSLINPSKSTYFAAKIESIKTL